MKRPEPRETSIFASKMIKGLFYEGFKKEGSTGNEINDDDLIIAFHYNGVRFDLFEFVQIKPDRRFERHGFKKIKGQPLLGKIVSIEPDSEKGEDKLVIRVDDCESPEQDLFRVTEIKKERNKPKKPKTD